MGVAIRCYSRVFLGRFLPLSRYKRKALVKNEHQVDLVNLLANVLLFLDFVRKLPQPLYWCPVGYHTFLIGNTTFKTPFQCQILFRPDFLFVRSLFLVEAAGVAYARDPLGSGRHSCGLTAFRTMLSDREHDQSMP
jgi:hypothetical protein